jgi:hypothetical protein
MRDHPPSQRCKESQTTRRSPRPETLPRPGLSGKPRQRGANFNPLGCRVFDMNCGWAMYRKALGRRFYYACGAYAQSGGRLCDHNSIEGENATRFVSDCIRQRVLTPSLLEGLRSRIRTLAEKELGADTSGADRKGLVRRLAQARTELRKVTNNLALAESDAERRELRSVFREHQVRCEDLERELSQLTAAAKSASVDEEIIAALSGLERMGELACATNRRQATTELFKSLNVRLYVRFEKVTQGTRRLNRVTGGVLTFGRKLPPVPLFEGRRGRANIEELCKVGGAIAGMAGLAADKTKGNPQDVSERDLLGNEQRVTRQMPPRNYSTTHDAYPTTTLAPP